METNQTASGSSTTTSTLPIGSSSVSIASFPFLDPKSFQFDCVYPDCDLKFTLTNDLYYHIRDHNKELVCPRCNNKFKCMASLVYHVRTHTGSKPYICPLPRCKFVTATKGNLKAHLLANSHRETMSLPLLNAILSLDTNHARPEVTLHSPRQRKKRRQSPNTKEDTFEQPKRKRNRSSISNSSSSDLVQLGQLTGLFPTSPSFTLGFNTSNFYQHNNNANMKLRSPASSLTHQWEDFNFITSPIVNAPHTNDEEEEDLTISIKKELLDLIDKAESFKVTNQMIMNDDKFLMELDHLDGVESTRNFYGQSKFGRSRFLHHSDSNTPPLGLSALTESSSEEPKYDHDMELIVPF